MGTLSFKYFQETLDHNFYEHFESLLEEQRLLNSAKRELNVRYRRRITHRTLQNVDGHKINIIGCTSDMDEAVKNE